MRVLQSAHDAWTACERERDRIPPGPERDEVIAWCEELRAAYEDAVAALFPEIKLD